MQKIEVANVSHQHTNNPLDIAKAIDIPDYQHMCWPTDELWGHSKTAQCTMIPKNGGCSVIFDMVTFKNRTAGGLSMQTMVGELEKANGANSE